MGRLPVRRRPAGVHRASSVRRTAAVLFLTGILLVSAGTAAGSDQPMGTTAPAVVAAYGQIGTLAVAITQLSPRPVSVAARSAAAGPAELSDGAAAERPFPAASLVKLFVAEDILHQARTGRATITPADFVLLQDMIRRSDDPAASALWVRFGGGRMVADVAARYGLVGTTPPRSPGQWGMTTTTARDLARFLSLLPVTAHPADAAALHVWMRTPTALGADGFDQRFGLLGTVSGLPAVKQGWMCCVRGNRHLHSVGVTGDRVVVLLSEVPPGVGFDAARAALSAAAAALPPAPPEPARNRER